jgi:hypothetical protein
MLTLDQWKADANARPILAELLRNPIMANALAIIAQQALEPVEPPAGVDLIQFGAKMGYKREGFFEALAKLRSLAEVTKSAQTIKPDAAWRVDPKSMPEEKFIDPPGPLDNPLPPKPAEQTNGPAPVPMTTTGGPPPQNIVVN